MADLNFNPEPKQALTAAEEKRAKKLESTIESGSYIVVGRALTEILRDQLFVGWFGDYTVARFGLKRHAAYRRIRATIVAERIVQAGGKAPRNEAVAHALHALPVEQQVPAWTELSKAGEPTAKQVNEFVADRIERKRVVPKPSAVAERLTKALDQLNDSIRNNPHREEGKEKLAVGKLIEKASAMFAEWRRLQSL